MNCKKCTWIKVYDFKFPDGTKTIACEKYNKHLGFTNKKGQVKGVKAVSDCKFNCEVINNTITNTEKDEDDSKGKIVLINGRWNVEVQEAGVTSVIFSSKYKNEAAEKLNMFMKRKSWITGISYTHRYKKWIVKIYLERFKYKQIGTFKTFYEAKQALKEAKSK